MNIFETIFVSLGGYLIGYFITKYLVTHLFSFCSDETSLLETKSNKSVDDYVDKYYEDWKTMTDDTSIPMEERDKLKELYITEDTPRGKIVMCYDNNDDMYYYWTDRKDNVLYTTLDTVAQKYALTYHCKDIYHDSRHIDTQNEDEDEDEEDYDEITETESETESENETHEQSDNETQEENDNETTKEVVEERSVFAKFKSYNHSRPMDLNNKRFEKNKTDNDDNTDNDNTDNTDNDTKNENNKTDTIVKNRFHYRGTLYDWEGMIKPRVIYKSEPKNIDYATFKSKCENEN